MSMSLHEKLCHAQHSQLLVIDIQERLASAMPEKVLEKVIHNNAILLQAAEKLGIPVVRSEQYPKGLGKTLEGISNYLPETTGTIEKTCFSCSEAEAFNDMFTRHNRQQVVITGIESHICVLQTALQLQRQGYSVYVTEDATCSRTKSNHKNAMARLRQNDIIITNTESVLFEWLRDAKHPEFKSLSQLIK